MSDQQLDYPQIRRSLRYELARQRRRQQLGLFVGHLILAVVFTSIVWITAIKDLNIANLPEDSNLPLLVIFPTLLAFMSLLFHGIGVATSFGYASRRMRERALFNALNHEVMNEEDLDEPETETFEKHKRDRVVQLSDDGELISDEEIAKRFSGRK